MRIPFLPKVNNIDELGVEDARFRFTSDTRGGSGFLLAGSVFWLTGALVAALAPDLRVTAIIYGGLLVPFLGFGIARLQRARLFSHPGYAALVTFATMTELAALPVMILLRNDHPEALPGILMIADGAHLLILMWLHMDFTYFLAGYAKAFLGTLFLFGVIVPGSYPWQMAASGAISLAAALFVWRDSSRTPSLYLKV